MTLSSRIIDYALETPNLPRFITLARSPWGEWTVMAGSRNRATTAALAERIEYELGWEAQVRQTPSKEQLP